MKHSPCMHSSTLIRAALVFDLTATFINIISELINQHLVCVHYVIHHLMFFNLLKPYSVTSHCALRSKDSLCMLACGFYISRKGGAGEVGGVTCLTSETLCTL